MSFFQKGKKIRRRIGFEKHSFKKTAIKYFLETLQKGKKAQKGDFDVFTTSLLSKKVKILLQILKC